MMILRVALLDSSDKRTQIVIHHFHNQMVMIAHQHPVVDFRPADVFVLPHQIYEPLVILFPVENLTPIYPPIHQVVTQRPLEYPRLPWHGVVSTNSK
jgi:hypothetical protein